MATNEMYSLILSNQTLVGRLRQAGVTTPFSKWEMWELYTHSQLIDANSELKNLAAIHLNPLDGEPPLVG